MYRVSIVTNKMFEQEISDMVRHLGFTIVETRRPEDFDEVHIRFCIEPHNIYYARFDTYSCRIELVGTDPSTSFTFEPGTSKIKEVIIDDIDMQSFLR